MASISLIRIDSRLIHGQVITKWLKVCKADRVIIVDDPLSEDSFMGDIYKMAAPKGIKVEIYSIEKTVSEWEKNLLGSGNILMLFKDVETCYQTFNKGLTMEQIQIGGLPNTPGKTSVFRAVSLNSNDVEQLREISNKGVDIVIQIIPEEKRVELVKVLEKYKF